MQPSQAYWFVALSLPDVNACAGQIQLSRYISKIIALAVINSAETKQISLMAR